MRRILTLIAIVLAFVAGSMKTNAQALDGTYTVTQGNTVTVQIGAAYQSTLAKATNISYTWTAANSSITILSKTSTTCTIKGVTPTEKVRLNYRCSYRYDGYARSMNFYYEITVKSNVVSVSRVYVNPEEATMDVGEALQLTTEVYPTNATNKSIRWQTENYSIASVNSSGLVTARGAGKVKIWAYSQDGSGAADYCVVTVNEPTPVGSIELSETERTMEIGESFRLAATVLPDEAHDKSLQWTTSDANVATVSDGLVSAVGAGECDIVCTSSDGSNISAACRVTVNEAPRYWLSVNVPNGSYAIDITDLKEIAVKITPDEGYKVHSVTLNGEEISDAANLDVITLTQPGADALLNAVFEKEEEIPTNIDGAGGRRDALSVTVSGHTVNVAGLDADMPVHVYALNGALIESTSEQSFELPNRGVYVLRIGSRAFKVVI